MCVLRKAGYLGGGEPVVEPPQSMSMKHTSIGDDDLHHQSNNTCVMHSAIKHNLSLIRERPQKKLTSFSLWQFPSRPH